VEESEICDMKSKTLTITLIATAMLIAIIGVLSHSAQEVSVM